MMSKAYHQLMRGVGLTGPHKRTGAPEVEYWSARTERSTDAFAAMRDKNLIPFGAMIYRSEGEDCIGVFTDSPNLEYRGGDAELMAVNQVLVAALKALRADLGAQGPLINGSIRQQLAEKADAALARAEGIR